MKWNVFFFCVLHIFQNFPCTLGEKSKSVSFSRVYVCVKARLTLVSFCLLFFSCTFPLSLLVKEWECQKWYPNKSLLSRKRREAQSFERKYSTTAWAHIKMRITYNWEYSTNVSKKTKCLTIGNILHKKIFHNSRYFKTQNIQYQKKREIVQDVMLNNNKKKLLCILQSLKSKRRQIPELLWLIS